MRETEYDKLKAKMLALIKKDWGKRCETYDIEDFPDMTYVVAGLLYDSANVENPDTGRCPVCLVYEKFDKFWQYITPKL